MKLFLTIMLCVVVTMSTEGEERVIENENVRDARWTMEEENPVVKLQAKNGAIVEIEKKHAEKMGLVKAMMQNLGGDEALQINDLEGDVLDWFCKAAAIHVDSYDREVTADNKNNNWGECFEKPMKAGEKVTFFELEGCGALKTQIESLPGYDDPEKLKEMVVGASFLQYDTMVQAFSAALANYIRKVMKAQN